MSTQQCLENKDLCLEFYLKDSASNFLTNYKYTVRNLIKLVPYAMKSIESITAPRQNLNLKKHSNKLNQLFLKTNSKENLFSIRLKKFQTEISNLPQTNYDH